MTARIEIPRDELGEFCRKWKIAELSLFGSVLRDDFGPDSDVDVLVTFAAGSRRTLLDLVDMRDELREMFGRDVHLAEEKCLENPFRRREIMRAKERIYAA